MSEEMDYKKLGEEELEKRPSEKRLNRAVDLVNALKDEEKRHEEKVKEIEKEIEEIKNIVTIGDCCDNNSMYIDMMKIYGTTATTHSHSYSC